MGKVEIKVNGISEVVDQGQTLGDFLARISLSPENLAAEFNGEFLQIGDVLDRELKQGDRIELVRFVGGG